MIGIDRMIQDSIETTCFLQTQDIGLSQSLDHAVDRRMPGEIGHPVELIDIVRGNGVPFIGPFRAGDLNEPRDAVPADHQQTQ